MTQRIVVFPADRHSLYEEHGYSAAIRSGDLLFVSVLYSRILQYTLAFQGGSINAINVVVIFTFLTI